MNNSLVIEVFSSVLEVPQPPGNPEIHCCLDDCIEIRWRESMKRDGVPETLYYEIEAIDPSSGTRTTLAKQCSRSCRLLYQYLFVVS